MPVIYVATSKANQEWGADVGLGKNLYKLGVVGEGTPDEALVGFAGQTDWKVLKAEDTELTEADALERLARKEKPVDPNYYPKLRGAQGIFKVTVTNVENSALVALALEGKEPPKNFKIKPVDIAKYLISNALR
ncbi:hypothetical protein [Magnetospirillum sulfuroxidans]|uniref:Uncharacterized protein n=1 Tax=Magnetospirillum sulfuroxidans TaxID=611300 RepID=A0ABS5IA52_9PROT|nr:hypothetical protein [Magnetospirillum sulfuroxidans]MBR9971294.1 hypothetical protein [Magnetospirillum sulfuroxidans]